MLWKNSWISFKLAESFPSVYFLSEAINFKNVQNTMDNISKWRNRHL
jgi:hypothetical protein